MIRINLAKSNSPEFSGESPGAVVGGNEVNEQLPKIIAMFIFVLLVFGYERYILGLKEEKLKATQQELDVVLAQVEQFGSVKTVVEDLAKERNKLNKQLKVIQSISQKRAYKLKAIMSVRKNLPDDLWLTEMLLKENIVTVKGLSLAPTSVQKIVRKLSDADFVQSALTTEQKRVSLGNSQLQQFDIEIRMKQ